MFQEMWDKKLFQEASIDGDQTDKLVRILDSVVIKLEGGTDNDLKVSFYFKKKTNRKNI